jgi:hypothetical protein
MTRGGNADGNDGGGAWNGEAVEEDSDINGTLLLLPLLVVLALLLLLLLLLLLVLVLLLLPPPPLPPLSTDDDDLQAGHWAALPEDWAKA